MDSACIGEEKGGATAMNGLGPIVEIEDTKVWGLCDIVAASTILFVGNIVFAILLLVMGSGLSDRSQLAVAMYFGAVSSILLTTVWIKKRYGLGLRSLGLRQGNWGRKRIIWIGLASGLVYFCMAAFLSGRLSSMAALRKSDIIMIIAVPISISGFPLTVLGPIAEEIYCRGFLYTGLRKKWGETFGIIVQAAAFSIFHMTQVQIHHMNVTILLSYLVSAFGFGLLLGLLYKLSGTLYPCIIAHGVYNFLEVINAYLGKLE